MAVNVAGHQRASNSDATVGVRSWRCPWWRSSSSSLWYGAKQALKDVSMSMPKHRITAYIGPSGCGKSHAAALPEPHERPGRRRADRRASIRIGGTDIYDPRLDVTELRKRVGMVFQKSNPFPKSIYENVAYGPRILGVDQPRGPRRRSWSGACGRRRCGTRCRTGCTTARSASRAASSSASASPARSPWSRTCCSWTSRARRSTPSPPRRSRS